MKNGDTIRVGKGEFFVESFETISKDRFDVVMSAPHRPGVKFHGILTVPGTRS